MSALETAARGEFAGAFVAREGMQFSFSAKDELLGAVAGPS